MRRRRARSGIVLIELLLVMSALVIIFGLCVTLLYGLLRLDRGVRDHLTEATTRDRLARRFRLDVRAATRSTPGPSEVGAEAKTGTGEGESVQLELGLSDGRVVDYRMLKGRLVRTERNERGDEVSHDTYRFPSKAQPRFRVRRVEPGVFVSMQWRREPKPGGGGGGRPLRDPGVEALLARDLRLNGGVGEGGQ